jgi:predicted RNase H-like HicB family nuclease
MFYHFKIHKEKKGYWAECIEIPGCSTQGETLSELKLNAAEALNLTLDEPVDSKIIYPLPMGTNKAKRNVMEVRVDPSIAFAFLMRRVRLQKGLTQHQMKELLEFKTLFSYQKLEKSRFANPTLKSLDNIKLHLPEFPIQLLF